MPKLRVKIEMNKGGVGVRLFKLSQIASESLKFFQMLSKDAGIECKPDDWIARDFSNGSVEYECQTARAVPKRKVNRYEAGFRSVLNISPSTAPFHIRPGTMRQFSHVAGPLEGKEVVSFAVLRDHAKQEWEWFRLNREKALQIQKDIPPCVEYYGPVQGLIHSFYKETEAPHVTLREQVSGSLVKCFFPRDQYENVIAMLRDRQAVVYAEGMISENVITGAIESVESERYRVLKSISRADLDAIFGTDESLRAELSA